ncbi:11208_t:CDS:2 [Acaulospora morrowiae]|uniref:11208_t:CDS:1 n=1 Tax=Acaulospora morrowiae TaxID=94023 RepID=A0A9N8V435_9GLOM|nr:11208_t:CDS:2 [Acaulospora morrowiae]
MSVKKSTNFDFKAYEFCSDFSIFIINESSQENETLSPKEYKVHRYILSQQSRYFKVLFESSRDFTEHKTNSVTIRLKDPHDVFQSILNYMYTGYISINHKTLISILTIADRFDIEKLTKHAVEYFTDFLESCLTYFVHINKTATPLDSLDLLISPEEILSIYIESQESEFEDIIPDWFLAISFDKLWDLDPDAFNTSRLERILKSDYVQFKNENQKLSVIKRIIEDRYDGEGYNTGVGSRWSKMVLALVMPFASENSDEEEDDSNPEEFGESEKQISDAATIINKKKNEIVYTFEELEKVSEKVQFNEKIYQLFQLVDFSSLEPNTWADILADKMIPERLVVQGLFRVLKEDNNKKPNIIQENSKWLEVLESYKHDMNEFEYVLLEGKGDVSSPSTTIEHFDQLKFEIESSFSDIEIHINDKSYDFHKIILSKESEYFRHLFSSSQITQWTLPWNTLHPEVPIGFVSMIHLFYDPNSVALSIKSDNDSPEKLQNSTKTVISILLSSMQIHNAEVTSRCLDSIQYQNFSKFLLLGCGKLDPDLSKLEEHQKQIREIVVDIVPSSFMEFHDVVIRGNEIPKDFIIEILDKCLEKRDAEECDSNKILISLFKGIFDRWFPNANSKDETDEDIQGFDTGIEYVEKTKAKGKELREIRHLITRYIDPKRLQCNDMEDLERQWWMPKDLFHAWLIALASEKRRKESTGI